MCKLLVGIKTEKNNTHFKDIIETQYSELTDQKDGIGAIAVSFDDKVSVFRSVDEYHKVFSEFSEVIDNSKLVALHTRTGTSGNKDIDNVHFFEVDNHLFAHNGFVGGYSTRYISTGFEHWQRDEYHTPMTGDMFAEAVVNCSGCKSARVGMCKKHLRISDRLEGITVGEGEIQTTSRTLVPVNNEIMSKFCDSYHFLYNLPKPTNKADLDKFAEAKSLSGMGFLLDKNTLDSYLIIKKKCYTMTDKKSYGVFFSYEPETETEEDNWDYAFGIPVLLGTKKVKIKTPVKELSLGTFKLEFKPKE